MFSAAVSSAVALFQKERQNNDSPALPIDGAASDAPAAPSLPAPPAC
jgi:hypothetical protein